MPGYATFEDILAALDTMTGAPVIGIDGLPCAGKSTLADRLVAERGASAIYLDDFVIPASAWPRPYRPGFPFSYIRYDEFRRAVRDLCVDGACSFHKFDWASGRISQTPTTVARGALAVIEGVSALNADLCRFYGLKVFVESDRETCAEAAIARAGTRNARVWRNLFMPSADIYMMTRPRGRADLIYAGRGARNDG